MLCNALVITMLLTLSNLIHIGGKVWENKLNAVHLVTNTQQSFQVAM